MVELAGKQVGDYLTHSSGDLMELPVSNDDGIQTGITVIAKLSDDFTHELTDIALCKPTSDEAQLFTNSGFNKTIFLLVATYVRIK